MNPVPIGLIPYIQAMLLARFLRNDLDNYPVFFNEVSSCMF